MLNFSEKQYIIIVIYIYMPLKSGGMEIFYGNTE